MAIQTYPTGCDKMISEEEEKKIKEREKKDSEKADEDEIDEMIEIVIALFS